MKKTTFISNARALVSSVALFLLSALSLSAQQFGLFTYSVTNENTVTITDYPEDATGEVVIPAKIDGKPVTEIGYAAFRFCRGLTSVTIPDSVTLIDSFAFEECSGLTSVTIGNSAAVIGGYAFYRCIGLTSVTIPDSVTEIGSSAFWRCSGLTSVTIGNSVTSIGQRAFQDCSGLTSVTIPDSVTSIGERAFEDCSGLTSVTIGNSVTEIRDDMFSGCSGLASMTIGNSVTSIDYGAFRDSSSLIAIEVAADNLHFRSIEGVLFSTDNDQITLIRFPAGRSGAYLIPDSVTFIGARAFEDCRGLTSVTIPDSVTRIRGYAFSGCSGLTSVTIGNSVAVIGVSAFRDCSGLASVTIPDSVVWIGGGAFLGCSSLASVTIGNSVSSIGAPFNSLTEWTFADCSSLTSIEVAAGNLHFRSIEGVLFSTDNEQTTLIQFPAGRSGAYLIPDSVTSIGDGAFEDCSGLTSVMIPDSVTSIGGGAFLGCSGLASVTIGNSVTEIGSGAFRECGSLTSIEVAAGNLHFRSIEGVLFSTDNEQSTLIQFPTDRSGAYLIPDSVTSIGGSAFEDCSGLTSVTIPDSVTSIGDGAFSGCSGLTLVTIGNSVTRVGEYTFYGCSALTSVTIPDSVTEIGDFAFYGCSGLTSVIIGDSVTWIGWQAFGACSGLTSVTIPDSVVSISDWAFSGCSGLTSVTIGESVTSIGANAFYRCSSLSSILFLGGSLPFIYPVGFGGPGSAFSYGPENRIFFYLSGSTGFPPTLEGSPTVMLDSASDFAVPSWLLAQDLPYDADLGQDLNGDGYPLLTAYALDLDPSMNLAPQMPQPELGEGTMAMSFHGDAQGIRYTVETSTDLQNWTTDGVTLSDPNEGGMRSATVDRGSSRRFLRLVVDRE